MILHKRTPQDKEERVGIKYKLEMLHALELSIRQNHLDKFKEKLVIKGS